MFFFSNMFIFLKIVFALIVCRSSYFLYIVLFLYTSVYPLTSALVDIDMVSIHFAVGAAFLQHF